MEPIITFSATYNNNSTFFDESNMKTNENLISNDTMDCYEIWHRHQKTVFPVERMSL